MKYNNYKKLLIERERERERVILVFNLYCTHFCVIFKKISISFQNFIYLKFRKQIFLRKHCSDAIETSILLAISKKKDKKRIIYFIIN